MKLVVLVTGATSGIGTGIASRFLDEGHKVIMTGRRSMRIEEFKKALISSKQDNLHISSFDITNHAESQLFVERIPEEFRDIDVLVNNAGLALGLEPAYQAELSAWDQMIDTNIKGLVNMTNLILPGMVERSRGHIFNIGSVAGTYPYPGGNVYGASKAFVHEYTSELRLSLSGTSIRVTSIEPGMVGGTEFSNVRLGDDDKAGKVYEGIHAMSADDIAEAIYWSASLPSHVSINRLELMPVQQGFSSPQFHREITKTQ
jgi:3-hydroxy acid dehydrogenase/malonic semialdehyde reductase